MKKKKTNTTKEDIMDRNKVKKALDLLRGQKIIARNEVDGFYYPGKSIDS